ncbi:hypothetical protein [Paenibacillus illinoisensis]|uniref:hypothetical protein n=1 Tax=Paenibacillus illinoisensis TaxID=59845 RepID=UPI003D2C81E1
MVFEYDRVEKLDEIDYNNVKLWLLNYLIQDIAAKRNVCTYSEISNYIKLKMNLIVEPMSSALSGLLADISIYEHEQGDPLLSVVVVNKETRNPGDGFFKLAKDLGRYTGSLSSKEQKDEFFISELNAVHKIWEREYDPEWSEYLRLKKKFEGR